MPFFVDEQTYKREITDPTGEKSWVELRPLNAGDRAMLEDSVALSEGDVSVKMGTMRLMTMERAIVNWGLSLSPTRSTIEALHPEVFEQIFNYVSFGEIPEDDSPLDEAADSNS